MNGDTKDIELAVEAAIDVFGSAAALMAFLGGIRDWRRPDYPAEHILFYDAGAEMAPALKAIRCEEPVTVTA